MFDWLRRLFGRKKAANENLVEIKHEPARTDEEPQPMEQPQERMAPHSTHEPDRPEKTCPHCGSPNDKFVHICWMCKAEI